MRHRRRKPYSRRPAPAARLALGEGGERRLQDWLDRDRLAYLFLDQTPQTMPHGWRGRLKRPDFIVVLPRRGGCVAIDAKAKHLDEGRLTLATHEHEGLAAFTQLFQMPVFYACFPPDAPYACLLLDNARLADPALRRDGQAFLMPAPELLTAVSTRDPLEKALAQAGF